jgi:hypothetical protein
MQFLATCLSITFKTTEILVGSFVALLLCIFITIAAFYSWKTCKCFQRCKPKRKQVFDNPDEHAASMDDIYINLQVWK